MTQDQLRQALQAKEPPKRILLSKKQREEIELKYAKGINRKQEQVLKERNERAWLSLMKRQPSQQQYFLTQNDSYSPKQKNVVMPDMSIYKLISQEVHKPDYRSKYCGKSQLRRKVEEPLRASAMRPDLALISDSVSADFKDVKKTVSSSRAGRLLRSAVGRNNRVVHT